MSTNGLTKVISGNVFRICAGVVLWGGACFGVQEHWGFETQPLAKEGAAFVLRPLSRPSGNLSASANETVSRKTTSAFALKNPALVHSGDVRSFDIGEESWSLSGWFCNAAPEGTMTGIQTLAGTRQSASQFKGWDLLMLDGKIRFMSAPLKGTGSQLVTSERYDDERWHFFRLQWDAEARHAKLSIDDKDVGEVAGVALNGGAPGRTFVIGAKIRNLNSGETLQEWNGLIDEWLFESDATGAAIGVASLPAPADNLLPQRTGTTSLRLIPLIGQVALTWTEVSVGGKRTIWVSEQPITEETRSKAQVVVTDLTPASANDWYEDPAEIPRVARSPQGWILNPNDKPLSRKNGVFVYTFRTNAPPALYFAVADQGEVIVPGENATIVPVVPVATRIQPIAQSPQVIESMKKAPSGLPVLLFLHPHTSRPAGELTHLFFGDSTMGWREGLPFKFKVTVKADHILVEPYDRVWINRKLGSGETSDSYDLKHRNIETWWYGTNSKIGSPEKRKEGVAVNYTERWLLWMLDWVIENYRADGNRVYAAGTSMGTGVQRLALANPNRFASVDVLVPFIDWSYAQGPESNARRMMGSCGPMNMQTSEGILFADRMNLVKVVSEIRKDLPFVIARCGRNDTSVFWMRKPAYFRAMNDGRHGLLTSWDQGDHGTAGRKPVDGFPSFCDIAWYAKHFALNKSYPAITDCSLNDDFGDGSRESGRPEGFINRGMDWEVLADEIGLYRVRLFNTLKDAKYPIICSVTPRRLQNFSLTTGELAVCRIEDADGVRFPDQRITADDAGRITVSGVSVPEGGIILSLQKASKTENADRP
jgi:hypothetical protein